MAEMGTITSKRQLTIPASIFRQIGFQKGQKVLIAVKKGKLQIEPAVKLVEELAGCVRVPKRFRGLSLEGIVRKAKREHFKSGE